MARKARRLSGVLDVEALLAGVGGDQKLLREFVSLFLADCPKLLTRIKKALARRDADSLAEAAHALKGMVGNFSRKGAYTAAAKLATMGRKGSVNRSGEALRALQQEMKSVSGILIDRYMTREELSGLFHLCDAYVSLHRSEGFGLTLAETMSLGKPVIATAYSSNMDFMTPANSYLVACRLVELERDYGPYQKGNLWAEPDLQQAAILMRCVMDNPEEARQKGQQAKQDMERLYGVQAVSNLIMSRLERIQGQPRRTKQTI